MPTFNGYKLSDTQYKNMMTSYNTLKKSGATQREIDTVLGLGWSETRMRNIGEGGSASASKQKTGRAGAGVYQITHPDFFRQYKLSYKDAWDVGKSAMATLRYVRNARERATRSGYALGTEANRRFIFAGFNAGLGSAKKAMGTYSKDHGTRALKFAKAADAMFGGGMSNLQLSNQAGNMSNLQLSNQAGNMGNFGTQYAQGAAVGQSNYSLPDYQTQQLQLLQQPSNSYSPNTASPTNPLQGVGQPIGSVSRGANGVAVADAINMQSLNRRA